MNINIEIDDDIFNNICKNEIDNISKEELHTIVIDCIKQYLGKDETIKALFFQEARNPGYYDNRKFTTEPSSLLKSIVEDCDFSGLQGIVDKAIEDLNNKSERIIREVLIGALINGLTRGYNFEDNLKDAMMKIYDMHDHR